MTPCGTPVCASEPGGGSGAVLAPGKVMIDGSHSTARSCTVLPDLSASSSA